MGQRKMEWGKVSECLKKDVFEILQQGEGPVNLHKFYIDKCCKNIIKIAVQPL